MKIIIIGAGFTGGLLARALIAENNRVVLIDNDAEKVRSAGDQLDCTVVEADGTSLPVLEKAGVASADALVALTGDDETNMIICSTVEAVYPGVMKIARVRSYDHFMRISEISRRTHSSRPERPVFGIDHVVNPDVEAAESIMRAMEIGAVGSAIEIGGGYAIAELPVAEGCPVDGVRLKDLQALEGWRYLVAFIESDGETSLPNGESMLKAGDRAGILVRKTELAEVLKFTGAVSTRIDKVAIFGADNIGALTVAAQMDESPVFWYSLLSFGRSKKRRLTVIDRDLNRCRGLSEKFPEARILNGDITDDGLLQNEGVCESDLMVAASGNYERNLLTAAYMKLKGVKKVIALTSDSAFAEIAEKLGVDVSVPMRDTVIDAIMSHLRGRNVKSVRSIGAREFEIVSCEVSADSKAAGLRIRDIDGLEEAVVLLVRQPGTEKSEIPGGSTELRPGAHVVIIMPAGDTRTVRMFAGRPEPQP